MSPFVLIIILGIHSVFEELAVKISKKTSDVAYFSNFICILNNKAQFILSFSQKLSTYKNERNQLKSYMKFK